MRILCERRNPNSVVNLLCPLVARFTQRVVASVAGLQSGPRKETRSWHTNRTRRQQSITSTQRRRITLQRNTTQLATMQRRKSTPRRHTSIRTRHTSTPRMRMTPRLQRSSSGPNEQWLPHSRQPLSFRFVAGVMPCRPADAARTAGCRRAGSRGLPAACRCERLLQCGERCHLPWWLRS